MAEVHEDVKALVTAVVVEEHAASEPHQQAEQQQEQPVLSKRQRKKQLRAQELQAARQEHKKKAKREHKQDGKGVQTPVAEYTFANGYRMVKPYVYEFRTHAKQRWYNRELLDVFVAEFGANSPEYYKFAIQSGRITLNYQIVPPDTKIKNGDLIIHKAHRHEPPVSGEQVAIVHEDDDVVCTVCLPLEFFVYVFNPVQLVVCKPPSIATHPCGAYRHNSLHSILQHMRPDLSLLHIVHRLDRLTSGDWPDLCSFISELLVAGIVLFAKNPAKAKALSLCISERQAQKTYLARGRGLFPTELTPEVQQKIIQDAQQKCPASSITFTPEMNEMLISCPLRCLSARDGVWECHADGKPSETIVSLVANGNATCLVKCKPITGRTHQIRLHLQLIGFPIANDPCYGGELHFGESQARLTEIAKAKEVKDQLPPKKDGEFSTPKQEIESEDEFMQRTCSWCYIGADEAFNETQLHCSKIWLHALEYKLDGQVFQAPEPSWAASSDAY